MELRLATTEIAERDTQSGITTTTTVRGGSKAVTKVLQQAPGSEASLGKRGDGGRVVGLGGSLFDKEATVDFLKRVFLPKGYPDSVTPDYARYQIYNALQAFCNSLASLIASRALLEGHGIGDPTASATNALLLTVVLDVCSRMTTILSAHHLGTSLVPEAKRYRLLADILNDLALVLDTVSPVFNQWGAPQLRVAALCLSAACRALCGIVAGGSKAPISLHFASPPGGKGDIGDVNAKDASKETVLALFGMLMGSLIVPRLTTPFSTYTALFLLVGLHVGINYFGVQGLVLRTFNPQRLWLSWYLYTNSPDSDPDVTPEMVNAVERIFPVSWSSPLRVETFRTFRDPGGRMLGRVTLGSSLSELFKTQPLQVDKIVPRLQREGYALWLDSSCVVYPEGGAAAPVLKKDALPHVHLCFKEGSPPGVRVRAWLEAGLVCKRIQSLQLATGDDAASVEVSSSLCEGGWVKASWGRWKEMSVSNGWEFEDGEADDDLGSECGVRIPEPKHGVVSLTQHTSKSKKDV